MPKASAAFLLLALLTFAAFPAAGQSLTEAFDTPKPRNELMAELQAKGISTRPGTHAITEVGYYRERFGLKTGRRTPTQPPSNSWYKSRFSEPKQTKSRSGVAA